MTKLLRILTLAIASAGAPSFAASSSVILNLTPGNTAIQGVNIASGATLAYDAKVPEANKIPSVGNVSLTTVAAGVNKHPFMGFPIDVYVGELFLSEPAVWDDVKSHKVDPLDALENVRTAVVYMDFSVYPALIPPVWPSDLLDTYNAAFDWNNFDVTGRVNARTKQPVAPTALSDALKAFEDQIQLDETHNCGDIHRNESALVVFDKGADGTEWVQIETPTKGLFPALAGPKGFHRAILSTWLGVIKDRVVRSIKDDFVRGRMQ